ncbi:hypothetical protein DRH29_03625 [candidate division Kazan bacterium]|uniref:Uncharacterized protein n=1 Tax=candidate division Kazan bacterium TaxID=2202143 RepID=A0A420ZC40_UNCK3|nr:MAG: hypothetical protein DRH29_03625 [candidate division Kazan bacterium]
MIRWRNLQGFGTVKFLLVSPEYLERLDFSTTFGEPEKSKVISVSINSAIADYLLVGDITYK